MDRDPCTSHYCYCYFNPKNPPCSEKEVQEMKDFVKKEQEKFDI